MADQKLYGICRKLGKCVDGLCAQISMPSVEYLGEEEIPPTNIRKPKVPEFCRLNVSPNKIGWYTQ